MEQNLDIDKVDLQIISLLMADAKIPYTEIAKKIRVSGGTVHVRMKKLEDQGIVKGSTLVIDASKLGFDLTAFLGVYLEKGSLYKDVIKDMKAVSEITEVYYTTGVYSMFVKVVCRNTEHLRKVLNDKIQTISGIERTETIISLEESIKRQVNLTSQ